jgi:hypothetical protein
MFPYLRAYRSDISDKALITQTKLNAHTLRRHMVQVSNELTIALADSRFFAVYPNECKNEDAMRVDR